MLDLPKEIRKLPPCARCGGEDYAGRAIIEGALWCFGCTSKYGMAKLKLVQEQHLEVMKRAFQ